MVRNGIDCIEKYAHIFWGKRLGLITSISGVNQKLRSTVDILSEKFHVTALFAPEHGVRGDKAAGQIVGDDVDEHTKIPVYSLYRKDSRRLTPEMMANIDAVVYDIQDLGVRWYTFISTMYYAMQSCEENDREMVILDRPDPLGGKVEGNLLRKGQESFVGAYELCIRYGLTAGELANMIYEKSGYHFKLSVIPAEGWNHDMLFPDTGNIWVMPSLGIPRFDTALIYAGTCLFEGTNISEGRGTSVPFEIVGAPFVKADTFAYRMNGKKLPGVIFRPVFFTPSASKYKDIFCQGVQIHITDYKAFEAVKTGIVLLDELRNCYSEKFEFLPPYKEGHRSHMELLFGNRKLMDENADIRTILEECDQDSKMFAEIKSAYYIYR